MNFCNKTQQLPAAKGAKQSDKDIYNASRAPRASSVHLLTAIDVELP